MRQTVEVAQRGAGNRPYDLVLTGIAVVPEAIDGTIEAGYHVLEPHYAEELVNDHGRSFYGLGAN
jgi:hypothetical protein